jgi:cell wall-associated NlpC family hydrolase
VRRRHLILERRGGPSSDDRGLVLGGGESDGRGRGNRDRREGGRGHGCRLRGPAGRNSRLPPGRRRKLPSARAVASGERRDGRGRQRVPGRGGPPGGPDRDRGHGRHRHGSGRRALGPSAGRIPAPRGGAGPGGHIGYHYQHHHIPDFDPSPYPNWPWLPVTLGSNSAGIDCSDFSQWYYNFGLGLKLGPASASQDDATNVTLQGGYSQAVSWDGTRVVDIEVPLQTANGQVPAYDAFKTTLETGDLLYIHNTAGVISHVIMWVGSVGAGGDGTPLILDSHDNQPPIKDSNGVVIPAGVHLRPFRSTEWYYKSFVVAHRIIQ